MRFLKVYSSARKRDAIVNVQFETLAANKQLAAVLNSRFTNEVPFQFGHLHVIAAITRFTVENYFILRRNKTQLIAVV